MKNKLILITIVAVIFSFALIASWEVNSFSPVGFWASPDGLNKEFDYNSGENCIFELNKDGSYQVLDAGAYPDQMTIDFNKNKSGNWSYANNQLTFTIETKNNSGVSVFSSTVWKVQHNDSKKTVFQSVSLKDRCHPKTFYKINFDKLNIATKNRFNKK